MTFDILNDALKGGAKTAKFDQIGRTWSGPLTGIEKRQATNFDTSKPEFWDDGNPKEQYVISIQTDLREDENDDGIRAVYIKDWGDQKKALRAALQAFGGTPSNGDIFTATYYADGEKPQRGFAPKLYKYEFQKVNPLAAEALNAGFPPAAQVPNATSAVPGAPVGLGAAAPAAPVAQAVVTAPAAPSPEQLAQVGMLLGQGASPEQIAGVLTGVTLEQIYAVKAQADAAAGAQAVQAAALASKGF